MTIIVRVMVLQSSIKMRKNLRLAVVVAWVGVLLPPLFLLGFLAVKAVDVPFWDQWELVPIIQDYKNDRLTFTDFWHQHNEHRIFFPRLVMVGLAALTKWNVKVEALCGLLIAGVAFVLLLKTLDNTLKKPIRSAAKRAYPLWVPPLFSLIWFSLVQWENWMWGWQIQWYLCVLGVMCVVYGLSLARTKVLPARVLLLLIGGGVLAQYSLGNGVLIWPVLIAGLLYRRTNIKQVISLAVIGLTTTFLYYLHYVNPPGSPPKGYALRHPLGAMEYFFAYLGRPLSYVHLLAPILGVLIFVTFVGVIILAYLKKKKDLDAELPWITLGLFAIGSAIITDLSRLGFGLFQGYSNRYTTISSLLLIATLVLAFHNREIWGKYVRKVNLRFVSGSLLIILVVLLGTNYISGTRQALSQSHYLRDIHNCTHQQTPPDVCLLSAYPNKKIVLPRLQYLKQIHWGGY